MQNHNALNVSTREVCEDDGIPYSRIALRNGKVSHLEKIKIGIPPIEAPKTRAAPEWSSITQRVDHFNPTDLRTWEMRYLFNSEFYEEGGPIFIFIGGEWVITPGYLTTGQMYDMARNHSGYMFYTEHRYYGSSFPTEDLCTYNLQYLSADQALADLAYFITYQKSEVPGLQDSKVVVVGGSYAGMLATWIRSKYPHLVDAALSSSAPLKAKEDFFEYFEVVGSSLNAISEECITTISEAIDEVERQLEDEENLEKISTLFRTCNVINSTEPSRSYFFSSLAGPFASLVQYAKIGELDEVCARLLSFEGTSFDKYVNFFNDYYDGYCLSDYEYYLNYLRNPLPTNRISRQWFYQTCTEYGFYQTSASDRQPFKNFELDLYLNTCQEVFGISEAELEAAVQRTNLFYGSVNPDVTKVVSVHGTVDPWHPLGALEDINSEAPVFVVEGASHCMDLSSIRESDLEEMKKVKTAVQELISDWIQNEETF